ncbi:MAG: hypothetical protein IPK16_33575 [Anaerolineales bacterium]|nr:hypothetical protein [Anaerolineales bacterium]
MRYRRHSANITGSAGARRQMYEYEMLAYTILEIRYPDLDSLLQPLRASAMTAEALRAHREGDAQRRRALIHGLWRLGAWQPALTLSAVLRFSGAYAANVSGGSTFTRPNWIKRLARTLLK